MFCIKVNSVSTKYEIKGTKSNKPWGNLKVSSQETYNALEQGVSLIRLCNVGKQEIDLYFMKYNEDFIMEKEVRYNVKKIK